MNQARTHAEWESLLMGEQLLTGLLGKILYTELDRTWLQTLIDEDIFSESPFGETQAEVQSGLQYLQSWRKENLSGISDQAFLDLQMDYTRMFVGIQKVLVPVWESVYFSEKRMVFQEQTLDVRNWYRRYSLEPEKLYQEPDDHIGLELGFVAHLSRLGLQALEERDEVAFRQALDAQRDFLTEHLLRWGFKWAQLVNKYARTDFYRGIGHLVSGALKEAAMVVNADLPEEVKG